MLSLYHTFIFTERRSYEKWPEIGHHRRGHAYVHVDAATPITELSVLLEAQAGEKLTPSVLSKRLVKYAAVLEQEGVRVVSTRARTSRSLSILCLPRDGSDGSDGKK